MAVKTYSINVANLGLQSSRPEFYFNSRKHNVDAINEFENISGNPLVLKNGFDECSINIDKNTLNINFNSLIQNSELLSSIGQSASLIMDNNLFLDDKKFKDMTGGNIFGCSSLGYGPNTKVAIFKRSKNSISIEKQFKYISYENSILLNDYEFTEVGIGEKFYCITKIENPINRCNIVGSKKIFTDIDMLNASFDYKNLINHELEEWKFLDLCEYIPYEEIKTNRYSRMKYGLQLHTKYFPIYKHFAIIGKFDNGLKQLVQTDQSKIDCRIGSISLDSKDVDIELGELNGIYIFYSVLPMCFSGENTQKVNIKSLLFNNYDIIKIGINNTAHDNNIYISENIINLNKEPKRTFETFNIEIPDRYKRCFIEPDSPIIINGINISDGSKFNFINKNYNSFSVSPPDKLYSMLKEARLENNCLYPSEFIGSDAVAVYGLFNNGSNERFSLMSISNPFGPNKNINEYISYGSIEEYAGSLFSNHLYGTKLSYINTSSKNKDENKINEMVVNVTPKIDGYNFILPAWTLGRKISIYNASDLQSSKKITNGWKFIEPDIVIFEKDMTEIDTYRIVFEPIVYPLIDEIDFINNVVKLNIDESLINEYNNLSKILILASHTTKIKIGHIDDFGIPHYFNREMEVVTHITPNYLHKSITGFKTILY